MSNLLTESERLIWAAAYAQRFDLSNPPPHVYRDNRAEEWERSQVHVAIEHAWYAVEYARECRGSIKEGFGEDSEVYRALAEMLEP